MKHLILIIPLFLVSCAGPTSKTTTTRMGASGQETVVTETPYVEPFDKAISTAIPALMNSSF